MACTDKSINTRQRESVRSIVLLFILLIGMEHSGSKHSPAHPNVCLCRDDLSAIQVDHLWSAVGQSSVPGFTEQSDELLDLNERPRQKAVKAQKPHFLISSSTTGTPSV